MLVLSRKKNESIVIGEGVEVTICEIEGNRVRLGIKAPKEVPIVRKELLGRAGGGGLGSIGLASVAGRDGPDRIRRGSGQGGFHEERDCAGVSTPR